ncbi:L,D-transpeptidase family protein [Leptospira interrogans]
MTAASVIRKLLLQVSLAVGCCAGAWSSAQAITIELKDVSPDRIERQRRAVTGELPLPNTPDVSKLDERLAAKGLESGSEVFIRIFKAESELELWMRKDDQFALLDTYPICHWSGTIGPKLHEGDKQNPEGFYKIRRRHLHLAGRWPRSLNLGFPNAFDRSQDRTGSYILVHGGCSSTGCFAMTDPVMQEIYGLTEKALREGQDYVNIHVFPFRMTEENLAQHAGSEWQDFWLNLKQGYDAFEVAHVPPRIGVCDKRYVVQEMAPGATYSSAAEPRSRRALRRASLNNARDYTCFNPNDETIDDVAAVEASEDTTSVETEPDRPHAKGLRRVTHHPSNRVQPTPRPRQSASNTRKPGFEAEAFFYRK